MNHSEQLYFRDLDRYELISPDEEQEILKRRKERRQDEIEIKRVTGREEVIGMRQAVENIHSEPDIERYIEELVEKTRKDSRVSVGSSPRGALAMLKLSMAFAAMEGRDYVLPDDVKTFARPALIHRLILVPELWMQSNAVENVISSVISSVSVPIIEGV